MARRLANVRTRAQTGFDYVMNSIEPHSPFGKKLLKERTPFYAGQEEELRKVLRKVRILVEIAEEHPNFSKEVQCIFHGMKDNTFSIERSREHALTVVELFEMKSLLLLTEQLLQQLESVKNILPPEFMPVDMGHLLDIFDPKGDRLNTFYIYDDFSPTLGQLRNKKHDIEVLIRKEQKVLRRQVEEKYGVYLTPKFDYVVSRGDHTELNKLMEIPELEQVEQDYMTVTFALKKTSEIYDLMAEMKRIDMEIEDEEEVVREGLSRDIWENHEALLKNYEVFGALDFSLAKAVYAMEHHCTEPEIIDAHRIEIAGGRQLQAEDILIAKKKHYMPVNISLEEGITCITGANMGGKTVSLKMVGLVQLLAQYGFFVPCESCRVGLANFIQILIGDSQSLDRGLSSFGSEMEELKEILDHCVDRSFILIDEIASGTNPIEGLVLTKGLLDFLADKPYMCLLTTHYDVMSDGRKIKNMQVSGLRNADFSKIKREIAYANRRERIEIIGRYMDYSLIEVTDGENIPKDALHIAEMLGINSAILDAAKGYLKE